MLTQCPQCREWTALPADGGQDAFPRVPCKGCGGALRVDSRYLLCRQCNRFHRNDYDGCPFCTVEGVSLLTMLVDEQPGGYTLEPKKRRSKRGDDYYWQLYMDYGDKTPEPLPEPVEAADFGENGHGQNGAAHYPGSNGAGNGYAPNGNGGAHIDLAVTETVPLSLFNENEQALVATVEAGSVKTAGNFNDFQYELIQDPSRLAEVAELLAQETVLGLDTETTGLDPHSVELLLLQVSTQDKVYIVDCRRVLPLALKGVLENHRVLKVAQNAKFEYEMLKQQAGITLSGIYDTMLAERLLTAGIGREISLKAIAEKYIGATLDKSVRESFYKLAGNGDAYLEPEQLHYAARDAFIMIPIRNRQAPVLKKEKLEQVAEIEFGCVAAVGDMELMGVKIDEARWRKIIADVGVQREAAASELAELLEPASMQATMFGVSSINLNSNQQLVEALFRLGVNVPDTMEATLVKYDHPVIKKLLEYRSHEKTLSAFGESVLGLINPKTGRIHPDFNQYGADTGRFSCTRPNVQQIPATSDFRKCFVAMEGYKLITSDYSQCELRILAELSGDPGFVNAFKSGGDLHTLTASQMFGVPVEEVQKAQRNAAKAINFGLAYGMGPGGLAPRLGVSLDEAKELISRYFKAYPLIQKWLDKAARDAVRTGYSATTLGRKRYYRLPDESLKRENEDEYRKQIASIERQGKNSPIQGSNADMTKLALIYLRNTLKGRDARTVNTVHDEIVVEAREDQAEEVKHLVEEAMVKAGEMILKEVPIVAEAAVADYWSK